MQKGGLFSQLCGSKSHTRLDILSCQMVLCLALALGCPASILIVNIFAAATINKNVC